MQKIVVVVLFAAYTIAQVLADDSDASDVDSAGSHLGQISLQVEHSLDEGQTFGSRGMLVIQSVRSGSASMDSFGQNSKESLRRLCDADGMYMLRLVASEEPDVVHRTAVHACNLVNSGLHDVFTVHLDWRNKVVGVSLAAGIPKSSKDTLESANGFKSKVLVQHMEMGPQPDTAAFIQRMEQEKLAKERGETKDNRSFLAKYWMYIIPVVLVLAMSGANPEAQR